MKMSESELRDSIAKMSAAYVKNTKYNYISDTITDVVGKALSAQSDVEVVDLDPIGARKLISSIVDKKLDDIEKGDGDNFLTLLAKEVEGAAFARANDIEVNIIVDFRDGKLEELFSNPTWYDSIQKKYYQNKTTEDYITFESVDALKESIIDEDVDDIVKEVKESVEEDVRSAHEKSEIIRTAVDEVNNSKEEVKKEYSELRGDDEEPEGDDSGTDEGDAGDEDPENVDGDSSDDNPDDGDSGDDSNVDEDSDDNDDDSNDGDSGDDEGENSDDDSAGEEENSDDDSTKKSNESFYYPGASMAEVASAMIPNSPTALRFQNMEPAVYENTFLQSGGFMHSEIRNRLEGLEGLVKREDDEELTRMFQSLESLVLETHDRVNSWISGIESIGLSLTGPLTSDPLGVPVAKAYARRAKGFTSVSPQPRSVTSFESGVEAALDIVQLKQQKEDVKNPVEFVKRENAILNATGLNELEHKRLMDIIQTKNISPERIVSKSFIEGLRDYIIDTKKPESEILEDAYNNAVAKLSKKFERELQAYEKDLIWKGVHGELVTGGNRSLYEDLIISMGRVELKRNENNTQISNESKDLIRNKARIIATAVRTLESIGLIDPVLDTTDIVTAMREKEL